MGRMLEGPRMDLSQARTPGGEEIKGSTVVLTLLLTLAQRLSKPCPNFKQGPTTICYLLKLPRTPSLIRTAATGVVIVENRMTGKQIDPPKSA